MSHFKINEPSTTVTTGVVKNLEVRNNHAWPDGTVLFSAGKMVTGKWTLRELLAHWWRNR